ncbi:MAG TPA: M20/M25/M40 family metallo-hydrolase [Vicinamibacterales bacterium]|nr:M20/M25/M40 family metallo-hydrolase [Vicinamibacterales bacterium]
MRVLVCTLAVGAVGFAQPGGDQQAFEKIRAEGLERSHAPEMFEHLAIDIGPRLTASPAHKRAAEYMRDRLAAFGLSNARLEPWHFGRGWTLEKLDAEMTAPRYLPLIAYADGWSASTAGAITGTPVVTAGKTPDEIAAMGAALKGAIVMTQPAMAAFVRKDRPNPTDPGYQPNSAAYATSVGQRPVRAGEETPQQRAQKMAEARRAAGAAAILKPSAGEHGTVFVTGRDQGPGAVPSVTMAAEQYNMILDLIARHVPVTLRLEVRTAFHDQDGGNAYNVVAELPGADPAVADEVVMIGGHLDSWHTGEGATDNADGATTVAEAMRILKASGLRPRRTIRVALWGGEEQGLLGSKAWVAAHLEGDANRTAREKFDVYYNIDNGTGPIYGFYLQQMPAVQPLFDRWLEPLRALGARRNTLEPIGSTDHLSFINAGVPGFNPIQSYVNYDIRTHHTNMDTVERLQEKDIQQAAVAMAWFAYESAMADAKIPRPAR